jgi:hypothetical protein
VLLLAVIATLAAADETKNKAVPGKISQGAKVFVAAMSDDFDSYLKKAIADKKVPLQIVTNRELADYEITGSSDTQKASTAKKVILGNWHSREEASIKVIDLKSSEVVWSYSVHKEASAHGKRSTAEACAKHLKEAVESK